MKFPYGISDFRQVIGEGYYFVDRSDHIRILEEMGKQLLFLRPRRFGKSLWLSLLENYYDLARAGEFEQLFGRLAIGQNPTPLHNQYLVMRWDFSVVDPQGSPDQVKQALHNHINNAVKSFALWYQDYLPEAIDVHPDDAIASFEAVLGVVKKHGHRFYLLIDEYDNFANEVLMGSGPGGREHYEALLYGDGLLKTLFKVVKSAAAGRGLERVFITGVSPVALSDATSGYNVAEHISFEPALHDLCGFWEAEVAEALDEIVRECGYPPERAGEALATMRSFYNGYAFTHDAREQIYNPTLALYYFKHFQRHCEAPRAMLDGNFVSDRAKIAYVAGLPGGQELILEALEQDHLVVARLEDRFGVAEMLAPSQDRTFMASLLTYLGVLTLAGSTPLRELLMRIPNLVVRKLYVERIQETLLPDGRDRDAAWTATRILFQSGDLQPVCDLVEQRYFPIFDNRDYRWANELTLKTAFLTLLFDDRLYIVDSETAIARSHADLSLIRRPELWQQPQLWDFLLEFKLLKLKEAGITGEEARQMDRLALAALPAVQASLAEARSQLQRYRTALEASYGQTLRLRTYAVVGLGFERLVWEEVSAAGPTGRAVKP
jgi:hypothetical protein